MENQILPPVPAETKGHTELLGRDLIVGYADQNHSFATNLPRAGTAVRQITLEDLGNEWLVLRLHKPFVYVLGSVETSLQATTIRHFLVRSRWSGCEIGARQTSVLLLVDAGHVLDTKEQFLSTDFVQVCWGMIPP